MRKRNFFKKSIASLLCLVMILSLWQPIVKAEDYASDDSEVQTIVKDDEIKFDSETVINADGLEPVNEQDIVPAEIKEPETMPVEEPVENPGDLIQENVQDEIILEVPANEVVENIPFEQEEKSSVGQEIEQEVSNETEKENKESSNHEENLKPDEVKPDKSVEPEKSVEHESSNEKYGPNLLAEPEKPNVSDYEKPVLEGLEIYCENNNDTKESKVIVKARAYDADSSISSFYINLNADNSFQCTSILLQKDETSTEDNLFTGYTTYKNPPEVEMHISNIEIIDAAGNTADTECIDINGNWLYSVTIGFKENNDVRPTVTDISIPEGQFNIIKDYNNIKEMFYFKINMNNYQDLFGHVEADFKDEFNRTCKFEFYNYGNLNDMYIWNGNINCNYDFELSEIYNLTLDHAYFENEYGKYDLDIAEFNSKQITFEYDKSYRTCYADSLELLLDDKSVVGETITPGQNIKIQLKIDKETYHLPNSLDINFNNDRNINQKYLELNYDETLLMYTGSLVVEDEDESTEWYVSHIDARDEFYNYYIYNNLGNKWEDSVYFYLKSSGEFIEKTKNIEINIQDNYNSTRIFHGEAPTTFTLEKLGIVLPSFKSNKQGDKQIGWFCNGKEIDEKSIIHCKSNYLKIYRLYGNYYLDVSYYYKNVDDKYEYRNVSIPFSKYNPSKEEVIKALNDNKPENYMENDATYGIQDLKIQNSFVSNLDLRNNYNNSYMINSEFEKGDIYKCNLLSLNNSIEETVVLPKNLSFNDVQEELTKRFGKPHENINGVNFVQWNFVPEYVHENVIHVEGHAQYDKNVIHVNYNYMDSSFSERSETVLVEFESSNPTENEVNEIILHNEPDDILTDSEYGNIIITPNRDISNLKINNGDYNIQVRCEFDKKDFISVDLFYLSNSSGINYLRQVIVYDKGTGNSGIQKGLESVALPSDANKSLKFLGWVLNENTSANYKSAHATYEGYNLVVNYKYLNDKNQYENVERIITFDKPNPTVDEIKAAIDNQVFDNLKEAAGVGEGYWKADKLLSEINITSGADYISVERTYDGVSMYQYSFTYNDSNYGNNYVSGSIYLPDNLSNEELNNILNEQVIPENVNSKLKFKGWNIYFDKYDNSVYGNAIYETYYLNVQYEYISTKGFQNIENRSIEFKTSKLSEKEIQSAIDKNAPKDIPNNKEYGQQSWKTDTNLNDMVSILENGIGYIYVENSYENVSPYCFKLYYINNLETNFNSIYMFLKKDSTIDEIKEVVKGIKHPQCNNNLTFMGWDVNKEVTDYPGPPMYNFDTYICTAKYDKSIVHINYEYVDENFNINHFGKAEIIDSTEVDMDKISSIIKNNEPKNIYKDEYTGDLEWSIVRNNMNESSSIIAVNVKAVYLNQDYYNIGLNYYTDYGEKYINKLIFVKKGSDNNAIFKYIKNQPEPEDSVTGGKFNCWKAENRPYGYSATAVYDSNLIELNYKYAVDEKQLNNTTIVKPVDFYDYTDENVDKVIKDNLPDVYKNEAYGEVKYKINKYDGPSSSVNKYNVTVNYEQGNITEYHFQYIKDNDLGYVNGYILTPENMDRSQIEVMLKEKVKCPSDSITRATYTGWVFEDRIGPDYNNAFYMTAKYKEVFVIYQRFGEFGPEVAYIDVFNDASKAVVLDELPGIGKISTHYDEEYFIKSLKENGEAQIYFIADENKHVHKPIFVEGHDATCIEEGVLSHYECECGKIFKDKDCTIELNDIVIPVNPEAHKYGKPIVEWSEDGKSCTATRKCEFAPDKHIETATAKVTSKVTKEPTSVDKGQTTYTAVFKESWAANLGTSIVKTDIPAKGYAWDNVNYEWSDDLKTCTATRKELNGSNSIEKETVKVTAKQTVAPTCLLNGTTKYIAVFKSDWCKGEVSRALDNIPAIGHNWDKTEYTWSEDGKTCTAKRICKNNKTHVEREVVTAVTKVAKNPTCNDSGSTTYTAVFNSDWAVNQSITKNDRSSLGHSWSTATYTWSEDGSSCTATRICNNDSSHVETATGTITPSVTTAATCDEMGSTTYIASFSEGWAFGSSITKVDIPATGHNWKDTQYTWSNNRKACIATRICENDPDHKETVFATITSDEGEKEIKYTASFDVDWAKEQTSKVKKEVNGDKKKKTKKDIKRKPTPPGVKLEDEKIADVVDEIKKAVEELENEISLGGDSNTKKEIKVEMGKATVVPKEILEAAKGKNVTVKLEKEDYTWEINGKDISASDLDEINLEVKLNTEDIPPVTVEKLAGDKPTKQLSLTHEGDFGFKATLSVNMGNEHAGNFGSLYYYDSDHKMVYIDSGMIMEDGSVYLDFSHASDYVIVVSEAEMTQEDVDKDLQPLESTEDVEVIEQEISKDAGSSMEPVIVIILIIICIIAIVLVIKKKNNK